MSLKLTLSVVTADVGGFVGHISSHPDIIDAAKERLYNARDKGWIIDYHVLRCGDDVGLIITHTDGCESEKIHGLVWNTLASCRDVASELKLYARESGFVKDFSGTLEGAGPGVAEIEFVERDSEPVVIFITNKTSTGSWNMALYKIFADPFNTPGLLTEPVMFEGFSFRVVDRGEGTEVTLRTPAECHHLLAMAAMRARYLIKGVCRNSDAEVAAVVSSAKLTTGGEGGRSWVEESEPSMILRCQAGFPAVGEAVESFTFPCLVEGWLRGAHNGPLMPVAFYEANPTRFDGPPRVIAAGFQISDGRLIGPHDMFDDPGFDEARRLAGRVTDYIRGHGPFEPHRCVGAGSDREFAHVLDDLSGRFTKLEPGRVRAARSAERGCSVMKGPRIIRKKAIDTERDPYLPKLGRSEVAVCKKCSALYYDKHWTLAEDVPEKIADKKKVEVLCPACQKIRDKFAGGYVTIKGEFVEGHTDEILSMVKNKEKRAMYINPLERIIEIKERGGAIEVSTTTEKLAQRIGKMLSKTFSGEVEYKWSSDVKLARVVWTR